MDHHLDHFLRLHLSEQMIGLREEIALEQSRTCQLRERPREVIKAGEEAFWRNSFFLIRFLIFQQLGDLGESITLRNGDQMTLHLSLDQGIQYLKGKHSSLKFIFSGLDLGLFPEKRRDEEEKISIPDDPFLFKQPRDTS